MNPSSLLYRQEEVDLVMVCLEEEEEVVDPSSQMKKAASAKPNSKWIRLSDFLYMRCHCLNMY